MERKLSSHMQRLDAVTGKIGQLGQWASAHPWQGYSGQWMAASNEFGQRVLVMNPMHIVHLSSNTKSKLVRIIEFCKSFTEKWFSHLLLLVILILYTCLGAWMFMVIEGGVEHRIKTPVIKMRDRIKDEVWSITHDNKTKKEDFDLILNVRLTEFEEQLHENFKNGSITDSTSVSWTFLASIVYCFTVFTTIGYGHIVPTTKMGRSVSIIYACIGIPLLLMVLADLGKLFTRIIKHVLKKIHKLLNAKKLKKVRKAGRRATIVQQNIAQSLKNHGLKFIADVKDRKKADAVNQSSVNETDIDVEMLPNTDLPFDVSTQRHMQTSQQQPQQLQNTGQHLLSTGYESSSRKNTGQINLDVNVPQVTISGPSSPFLYPTGRTGPSGEPIVLLSPGIPGAPGTPLTPAFTTRPASAAASVIDGETEDDDDEFNLPVSLALFILFLYMVMGAVIFTYTDNWPLSDSLYFVFISISTIGFGDLTPSSEWSMIVLSIYLLFGLALTSMCINVIQEQLAVAFEQTRVRLGTRMGFDIDQLNLSQIETTSTADVPSKDTTDTNTSNTTKHATSKSDRSSSADASKRKTSSGGNRKKSVSLAPTDCGDKNNNNNTGKKISSSTVGKNNGLSDVKSPAAAAAATASPAHPPTLVASNATSFALTNDSLGKHLKERREQAKRKGDGEVYSAKSIAFQEKPSSNLSNASVTSNDDRGHTPTPRKISTSGAINSNEEQQLSLPVAPRRGRSPRKL